MIDDGAIFYINGVEIHRFNMPAGLISPDTLATTNIGDVVVMGTFLAEVTNIVVGDNVVAVEVHQNGLGSSDIVFGAEMAIQIPSSVIPGSAPPKIQINHYQSEVVLSWPDSGWILEELNLATPNPQWMAAPGQRNPLHLWVSQQTPKLYRLRK